MQDQMTLDGAVAQGAVQTRAGQLWQELGRCGQAIVLMASLVATAGLMLATTAQAYGASCATSVDFAEITQRTVALAA